MPNSQEHNHLRRHAIMIVSQLPENSAEALTVLDYARLFGDGVPGRAVSRHLRQVQDIPGTVQSPLILRTICHHAAHR